MYINIIFIIINIMFVFNFVFSFFKIDMGFGFCSFKNFFQEKEDFYFFGNNLTFLFLTQKHILKSLYNINYSNLFSFI